MPEFDFSEFTWFAPQTRKVLYISIPNPGAFNLSPTLAGMMPEQIAIGLKGGDLICLRQADAGYRVSKSGSINAKEVIAALIDMGLSIPARYAVTVEDSCWIATLEKRPPVEIDPRKASIKPRKRGLTKLVDGEEDK